MDQGSPYRISDDRSEVDRDEVWAFLSTTAYWGRWRLRTDVDAQIDGAWRVVAGYERDSGRTVGFARAVSDGVHVAYLADVFVVPDHQGYGIGHALVKAMIEDGPGRGFRWLLHTADAHGVYADFGFRAADSTLLERPARRAAGPLT